MALAMRQKVTKKGRTEADVKAAVTSRTFLIPGTLALQDASEVLLGWKTATHNVKFRWKLGEAIQHHTTRGPPQS